MKLLISIAVNQSRGKRVCPIHLMLVIGTTSHEVVPVARAVPLVGTAEAAQPSVVASVAVWRETVLLQAVIQNIADKVVLVTTLRLTMRATENRSVILTRVQRMVLVMEAVTEELWVQSHRCIKIEVPQLRKLIKNKLRILTSLQKEAQLWANYADYLPSRRKEKRIMCRDLPIKVFHKAGHRFHSKKRVTKSLLDSWRVRPETICQMFRVEKLRWTV